MAIQIFIGLTKKGTREMNDPVAWINRKGEHGYLEWDKDDSAEINTPLYAEAVQLTDEKIEEFAYAFQLWQLHNPDKALEGIKDFAKSILLKAQEK